jgi:hypothetical protein
MKRYVPAATAMLLAVVTPLFAQSIPVKVPSPTPTPSAVQAGETVAGRITQVDTKAGTFSLKANVSRKVLKLKAGASVNLHQLRRGEGVEVTYSEGTATRVETAHSGR